jgi:hypothetical protein
MDQATVDAFNGVVRTDDVTRLVLPVIGRHLRYDHGLSRRKTALALGVKEKYVRDFIEEER